ncbi:MAG: ammonium transporter [Chloroflexi bacterium]|nr:ammonium transporter [Chloroflexota bacterium]
MTHSLTDILWILLCAGLVFMMQAGFLSLETGLTRNKNNINVAVKNIADFSVSTLLFWAVGFALMFGATRGGWLGSTHFLLNFSIDTWTTVFFLFQVMFCGTAVTIISGGVAERLTFASYLFIAILISAIVYPIYGHWAWNGLNLGETTGFLARLGFVDFAGSTVVHSLGGWATLAILLIIGPRAGRFPQDEPPRSISGANMPLAALGILLLWFGWIGFNGGSTLELSEQVPLIISNTLIAGSAGTVIGLLLGYRVYGRVQVELIFNGSLAGLVAITAASNSVSSGTAVIIGAVGALIMFILDKLLIKYQIDDAIGAIPVHLGSGIWGTLAVGLFGNPVILDTGLTRSQQIGIQFAGIFICGLWAFGITFIASYVLNKFYPLRVTPEDEHMGLNVSEHNASTELLDLLVGMETQSQNNDLSLRVSVEPFTEVGQIAQKYNEVMASLEQAVKRTDAIVNTAQDGIVTFSRDGYTILTANPAAETIFDYPKATAVGQPFSILIEPQADRPRQQLITEIIESDTYYELKGLSANGRTFPMELAIAEAKIGDILFYAGIVRDISTRIQIEKERDKALEANELKTRFLAIVSHELKTPLNAIMGLAEMVDLGVYGDVVPQQKAILQEIIGSAEGMEQMVSELLTQAQLDSNTFVLRPRNFETAKLIERANIMLTPLAQEKGLILNLFLDDQCPPEMFGDFNRINQVITNLIGNAIKYTDKGSINLSIHFSSKEGWEIIVADTGKGIPQAEQAAIFQPFHQVESPYSREAGGVGLGLSIVQQIVILMEGDISLSSTVGQGTTVRVTLPSDKGD